MKTSRSFIIEVEGGSAILGIEPGDMLSLSLRGGGKRYTASVEWLHATLARKHQRENPTGRKRRRLLTSSEQLPGKRLAKLADDL
jgi:hypothetical protein